MERRGFIHDMLDVKILILYVMDRVMYPVDAQKIYELCYQDDCLSYFDVVQAIPQMVASGHLLQQEDGSYAITEEGKQTLAVTADSIAFPGPAAGGKCGGAVQSPDSAQQLWSGTEILPRPAGDFSVVMGLDDEFGNLMTLELVAPTRAQARKLEQAFSQKAEQLYQSIMNELLASEERAGT